MDQLETHAEIDSLARPIRGAAGTFPVDQGCMELVERASDLSSVFDSHLGQRLSDDLSGTTLRDYELREIIGRGSMGTVYLAWHLRLKREVALKILQVDRFGPDEMEALGKLEHEHIVRALDAGEHDGIMYLVMELVTGVDAGELCRQIPNLPIPVACRIAEHAARGLDFAHHQGFVHRDVKPSNLMVAANGKSLLMDLGLAMDARVKHERNHAVGTAHYVAPEQILDSQQVDGKTDVYSLGCTLYHLLAGQPPFADLDGDTEAILEAHRVGQPKSLATLRRHVPEDLVGIVHRMMSKSTATRPSIRNVVEALAPFAEGANVRELVANLSPSSSRSDASYAYIDTNSNRHSTASPRWPTVAAIALAGMMVIALGYGPWNRTPRVSPSVDLDGSSKRVGQQDALTKLLKNGISEGDSILTDVELEFDSSRCHVSFAPGNKITVQIHEPPDAQSAKQSIEAWDLLELKLKAPEVFARIAGVWERTTSSSSSRTIRRLDVRSDPESNRFLQATQRQALTQIAISQAGDFVAEQYDKTGARLGAQKGRLPERFQCFATDPNLYWELVDWISNQFKRESESGAKLLFSR